MPIEPLEYQIVCDWCTYTAYEDDGDDVGGEPGFENRKDTEATARLRGWKEAWGDEWCCPDCFESGDWGPGDFVEATS